MTIATWWIHEHPNEPDLREANHLIDAVSDWHRAVELADQSRSDNDYAYEEEAWVALRDTGRALGFDSLPEVVDALRAADYRIQWR